MSIRIINGNNMEVMAGMEANSIDTIITDPPYGLEFMGKEWDKLGAIALTDPSVVGGFQDGSGGNPFSRSRIRFGESARQMQEWHYIWAKEVLRIARPGAMMLVFGGTRTYHRLTCAIEDAGWEIRDCMMWLYGSGFPKGLNISKAIDKAKGVKREILPNPKAKQQTASLGTNDYGDYAATTHIKPNPATDLAKQWSGYGTALKPAWEPIVVAMKPLDGTFAQNAEKWGVAGLNIDGGRIPAPEGLTKGGCTKYGGVFGNGQSITNPEGNSQGRWPANVILDETAAAMLDEQSGISGSNKTTKRTTPANRAETYSGFENCSGKVNAPNTYAGYGGTSRFFYCAKASRSERNAGLEGMPKKFSATMGDGIDEREHNPDEPNAYVQNNHPTVKPLKLMEYLCRLTRTPAGGVVLDPFGGSGTTALACLNTGRDCVIIEKDSHYCDIIVGRTNSTSIETITEEKKETPLTDIERRRIIIEEAHKKIKERQK